VLIRKTSKKFTTGFAKRSLTLMENTIKQKAEIAFCTTQQAWVLKIKPTPCLQKTLCTF